MHIPNAGIIFITEHLRKVQFLDNVQVGHNLPCYSRHYEDSNLLNYILNSKSVQKGFN